MKRNELILTGIDEKNCKEWAIKMEMSRKISYSTHKHRSILDNHFCSAELYMVDIQSEKKERKMNKLTILPFQFDKQMNGH